MRGSQKSSAISSIMPNKQEEAAKKNRGLKENKKRFNGILGRASATIFFIQLKKERAFSAK